MNKLADELRGLRDDEITRQIDETQRELFNLRFRLATRQLEDPHALGRARKKLARLKTIQTERRRMAEILTRGNVAEVQPQAIGAEIEGRVAAEETDETEE